MTPKIVSQEQAYDIDKANERQIEKEIRKSREEDHKIKLDTLRSNMTLLQKRANDLAQMKGASAWLTSLPLADEGFVLNKREFFDAISIRYRWDLKRTPTSCACNKPFESDHAMQCPLGGYVIRRHNGVRDLFAKLLDSVAHEVQIEPQLQPLTGENLPSHANTENDARLDVAARGFWQEHELAFFDVRVFNPFAKSYLNQNQSLEAVFRNQENTKKKCYNQRVIQVEHGTFTPIVTSSLGGLGRETSAFVSRLIEKLVNKNGMEKSAVANYVRAKLSFLLIRSQVACIRGSRNIWKKMEIDPAEMELVSTKGRIDDV